MIKSWTDQAWSDYIVWSQSDRKIFKRINQLIEDIDRNRYEGIGKPESLKYAYSGYWSRRITEEHRLVYKITDNEIIIAQCRTHYD